MKSTIETRIIINALPDKVWNVLTAFFEYPQWNPFIKAISGDVAVGNKIKVEFEQMTFKPKVLIFESNHKFVWLGHLLFKGIFDGKHSFELVDNGDGTTLLIQKEDFHGILIPLVGKKILPETQLKFQEMNEALKKRVEGK